MDYPQILCKTFLKLKVTTIILVMHQHFPQEILKQFDMDYRLKVTTIILVTHQHFPQEILKQLDMDYRPSLTWLQKFGTLYLKR